MFHAPDIARAREAQRRIAGFVRRTPLVRLDLEGDRDIWLKLENLQPIGSFKIRGAGNAMEGADPSLLANGVYTASAGNMAQGVAWCARERGIPCSVIVPEHAPAAKTEAIERLGGQVTRVSFEQWWDVLLDRSFPGQRGLFIHPFADEAVMAGNATIALEIFDELSDVTEIIVPYGGGGLIVGIASATSLLSPATCTYAVEAETAAPVTAAFTSGEPVKVPMTRTFIDGMGSAMVFGEMWPLVQTLVAGSRMVTVGEVEDAVRLIASRTRTIAEGAGAAALAAALRHSGSNRVVCIVSGGNIDAAVLSRILTASE